MFTTKPEAGEKITKLGGGDAKSPFTERPATYASKSPGPSASKMVPSIIGEDLTIRGNVILQARSKSTARLRATYVAAQFCSATSRR